MPAQPSTSRAPVKNCSSLRVHRNPNNIVVVPGQASKRRQRLEELRDRRAASAKPSVPVVAKEETPGVSTPIAEVISKCEFDITDSDDCESTDTEVLRPTAANTSCRPDERWRKLIPSLLDPYLRYLTETNGDPVAPSGTGISTCTPGCTTQTPHAVMCLYFDCVRTITVYTCPRHPLAAVLIRRGLFASAPSQPRIGISVELLMFYRALLEQSRNSVTALASALHTHYLRRGFRVTGRQGHAVQDPFRRSLGQAIKWFEVLQAAIDHRKDTALLESRAELPDANQMDVKRYLRANSPSPSTPPATPPPPAPSSPQGISQKTKHRLVKKAKQPVVKNEDPDDAFDLRNRRTMIIQQAAKKDSVQSAPSASLLVPDGGRRAGCPDVASGRATGSVKMAGGGEVASATVIPERVVYPQRVPFVGSGPHAFHPAVPDRGPPPMAGGTVPMVRDIRPGPPEVEMSHYNERPLTGSGRYGPMHDYPGPNFHPPAAPYPHWAHYANMNNAHMAEAMHRSHIDIPPPRNPAFPGYGAPYDVAYRGQLSQRYLPPPGPSMHNAFVDGRLASDVNRGAVRKPSPRGVKVEAHTEGPSGSG